MAEPFERDKDFKEYEADVIIGHIDEKELQLIFAELKNVEIGPEEGGTHLCQVNLPLILLNSLPTLYRNVAAKDGKWHMVFPEKKGFVRGS